MTKNDAPTESTTVQADTNIPTTSSSSKEPKGVRTTKGCLLVALCSALLVLSVGAAAIFLSIQPLHFDDSSTENSNAHLVYSAAPVNETITVLPTDEDVEFALAPSSSIPEQTTQRYTTLPGLIRAPQNTVYDAATVYSQQIIVEENKVPLCEIPFDQDPENCLNDPLESSSKDKWMDPAANFSTFRQWIRPLEYLLNITVEDIDEFTFGGSLDLLVEIVSDTNVVVLRTSGFIRPIDSAQLSVWECEKGGFICIHSVSRLLDKDALLIELSSTLKAGSVIRLRLNHFESEMSQKNHGIVVRLPSRWERDRSLIVGTQFDKHTADPSTVFPVLEGAEGRAVFKMCLTHQRGFIPRSNTIVSKELSTNGGELIKTCFRPTPPIRADQFGFILVNNMKLLKDAPSNRSATTIEFFMGNHLKRALYQWVLDETKQGLKLMHQITGMAYPQEMLTIVSSPLMKEATHSFGILQLRESWIERPKFVQTHRLLAAQIVHQWTSNIVTFCDECLQQGLSNYLEWIVSAEIGSPTNTEGRRRQVEQRFTEIRHRLLHTASGDSQPALGRASSLLTSTVVKSGGGNTTEECADQISIALYTLESTFGWQTISGFIALLFQRHSWQQQCVSLRELSSLFRESTASAEAQAVFDSMTSDLSGSRIPVVQIHLQHGSLKLSQRQLNGAESASPLAIPIEIVDDSEKKFRTVLNTTNRTLERVVSYAIAKPIAYARFIYNVDNYANYLRDHQEANVDCGRGNECSSIEFESFQNTFGDLCWALLRNDFGAYNANDAAKWWALFDKLLQIKRLTVHSDCACCMQRKASVQCRWTWKDKCSKIEILSGSDN